MSDGEADDSQTAASLVADFNQEWKNLAHSVGEIDLHVIGFGNGASLRQLQEIADASTKGKVHSAVDIDGLLSVLIDIAGSDVITLLEDAISQRVYDAVIDRLEAE